MAEAKAKAPRPKRQKVADAAVVKDQLPLADIVLDSDVQPRETTSVPTINEYKEAMEAGTEFPEIIVYRDPETGVNIAADGWHRVMAAREAGRATIAAEIRTGTKRDAILYSVSANATHGLRRTPDDKRRAVARLLDDEEWSQWSDNVIAEKVGVSQPFVSGMRKQRADGNTGPHRVVRTSDGRVVNTKNIGRKKAEPDPTPAPAPSSAEASNGHAPVSLVPDRPEVDGGEDEYDVELTGDLVGTEGGEQTFAARLTALLLEMADSDADETVEQMADDQVNKLADRWNDVIDAFNRYSDALEKVLQPTA